MYCDRCNRLVYKQACPGCGSKALRLPGSEDFCFLTEPEPLWTQALRDLLTDNGVEFVERKLHGAGMMTKTGIPQRSRFFVRYRDHQVAAELNEAFFRAPVEFELE